MKQIWHRSRSGEITEYASDRKVGKLNESHLYVLSTPGLGSMSNTGTTQSDDDIATESNIRNQPLHTNGCKK